MDTITDSYTQQQVYEESGFEVPVPSLPDEQTKLQKVQEEVRPSDSSATSQEVLLIVQPGTDPILVFRFCLGVRETFGADIAFVTKFQEGTAIKLAFRKPVLIQEILMGMEEVEETSLQGGLEPQPNGSLTQFLKPQTGKAIRVTLKAS